MRTYEGEIEKYLSGKQVPLLFKQVLVRNMPSGSKLEKLQEVKTHIKELLSCFVKNGKILLSDKTKVALNQ